MERGEEPKVNYDQEFNANYDVTKLTGETAPGKASIQAFFTTKGRDVYAILPRWPAGSFTIKDFDATHLKSVALLGAPAVVHWKALGNAVVIDVPALPQNLMTQPAWVLKLTQ